MATESRFILGDTWREIRTEPEVSIDQIVPDEAKPDPIEVSSVFYTRSFALTADDQRVEIPVNAKYVDILLDTGSGAYGALVQLGTAIDADALPILPNTSIKIPLQRAKALTIRMASGTGDAYIVANNENFRLWGQ